MASPAARRAIGRCANFWLASSSATPACRAPFDDILIVSGSLQALDLINGVLLARGDTVIIEQETYQGALTRLARLGVTPVGIPLDGDGMRMDALAAALADLKRRNIRPKYIYTIPTVQNPTGTHHAARAPRRTAAAVRSNTACRSSRTTATPTSCGAASGRRRSTP